MTLAAERRTRGEQIGDILTGLEHAWKMQPNMTFGELLAEVFAGVNTDDEVEDALRQHLRELMSGARDRT